MSSKNTSSPPERRALQSSASRPERAGQKSGWKPNAVLAVVRDYQIDASLFLSLVTFVGAYLRPHSVFAKMLFLSYKLPGQDYYDHGWDDLYFLGFYIVVLTFLRAFVMEFILKPTARYFGVKRDTHERFAEQSWLVIYYSIAFGVGFSIAYNSPYWLSTKHFWIDYPHLSLSAKFKYYYLLQFSFWLQQIFVLNIEKPRKDYLQYLFHHLVTCTLIVLSYVGNFTRIGNAVFVTMDFADIFLSLAKCFNYIRWRKHSDFTFVFFVIAWLFSRHYIYFFIVRSLWWDLPLYVPTRWDPSNGWYICVTAFWVFIGLFGFLQLLMIFWLYLIVRVVMKVVKGNKVADSRSDSELSDIDQLVEEKPTIQ